MFGATLALLARENNREMNHRELSAPGYFGLVGEVWL